MCIYSFNDSERRISIRNPQLPQPWINCLSNGTLHAFVSQAGGGYAWWESPPKNRFSRYRQNNLPIDSSGFYIYPWEKSDAGCSTTWRLVAAEVDAWRAEHEPGLTRFIARRGNLEAVLELFIAPGTDALVWDFSRSNSGAETVKINVFAYVELCLLDWNQDTDWACYVKHDPQTGFDTGAIAVACLYRHFHFNPHLTDCQLVYFEATDQVASLSGDRDTFVGNYCDERNHCGNTEMLCGDPSTPLLCARLVFAIPAICSPWPTGSPTGRRGSSAVSFRSNTRTGTPRTSAIPWRTSRSRLRLDAPTKPSSTIASSFPTSLCKRSASKASRRNPTHVSATSPARKTRSSDGRT